MIGSGKAQAPFTKRLTCTDTSMGCLAIGYSLQPEVGEDPQVVKSNATITINETGPGSTKLRVTITIEHKDNEGTALADVVYVYDGLAGGTGATVTAITPDLKLLVDQLNLIPGITAFALNAPHSLSLATDGFQALAETQIRNDHKYLECLHRDVSSSQVTVEGTASKYVAYVRVGNPEPRDRGALQLLDVFGLGVATGTPLIRVYRDDVEDYGSDPEVLYRGVMTAAQSLIGDNKLEASDIICPFIVEVTSTTPMDGTSTPVIDLNVKVAQSEI